MGFEIVEPDALLIGATCEFEHPVADCIARGFVARHQQQDEETAELLARHTLAIYFGMHHHRCKVVERLLEARFTQLLGVAKNFERHLHQVLQSATKVGVASTENHVCPVENHFGVAMRYAHRVADDFQREWCRQCFNKVELIVAMLLEYFIYKCARFCLHILFHSRNFPLE
jgi:hypothetical protein